MSSILDHVNPALRDFKAYQPGKPIEETARELGARADDIIKLASNENPFGPSPKALAAMRDALECAHLYPDGGGYYLGEALSKKLGVPRDHLIFGNGSNEVIEFLGHAFLREGDEIVTCEHAFVVYKLVAKGFGAKTIETPSPDYHHHLDAILSAITPRTRLIFIANPNNPTGTLLSQAELDSFMARLPENVIAIFDEAYFEYVDNPPDTLRFVRDGRNVVVLRTFSKIAGLAGLRIGYGIARPALIEILQKTRQPFNTSGIAQAAALAALTDDDHISKTKRLTSEERDYLQQKFGEMKLRFVPSAANFILVNVGDGHAVFKALLKKKIIVRELKGYSLPEWIRISIGTMEQNRKCIAALQEILVDR